MESPTFSLSEIAFFGRSLAEYQLFFDIRAADFVGQRVLDCAAGPSSFARETVFRGVNATAVDPLYGRTEAALRMTIRDTLAQMFAQIRAKPGLFTLQSFTSIEAAETDRRRAAEQFLADYYTGKAVGRYVAASLPALPFADRTFDLTLCGHLLFLYDEILDLDTHIEACLELCRVTKPGGDIRIHPVVNLRGEISALLAPLRETLVHEGIRSELIDVDYAFFRGATRTLVLHRP